ncbi:MAG TPA: Clp protease N-terminal domain-containing protein [Gemmatimonadaceae bacterium]
MGTEHLLLGLIRDGEGVGATALQNLNVELDEIQRRASDEELLHAGPSDELLTSL